MSISRMDDSTDLGPMRPIGHRRATQILIWGGVALILIGGFLAYPYTSSRMVAFPTSSPVQSQAAPTAHRVAVTDPVAAQASPLAFTPVPTSSNTVAPTPRSTPTPTPVPPTRIVIPVIDLDASIVPVSWYTVEVSGQLHTMWDLPETRAAGWHETSAPPGMPGNTVLNGHNTGKGEVFRDLYKLGVGDEIVVYAGDIAHVYTISETLILPEAGQPLTVRIKNAQYILPTEDERLTLVTCHPYGSLRNRLIVIARPAPLRAIVATPDWRSIINR